MRLLLDVAIFCVTCLWGLHDWAYRFIEAHDSIDRLVVRQCKRCGRPEFEHRPGVWEFY